jgi:hypothetical protein
MHFQAQTNFLSSQIKTARVRSKMCRSNGDNGSLFQDLISNIGLVLKLPVDIILSNHDCQRQIKYYHTIGFFT